MTRAYKTILTALILTVLQLLFLLFMLPPHPKSSIPLSDRWTIKTPFFQVMYRSGWVMGQKTGGTITGMQKDIVTMIPKNPVILIQKSSGIVSLKLGGQVIYPLRESTLSPILHSIAFPVTPNLLENPGPVEFSLSRDIVWGWKIPPVIVDFDVASTILRRCDLLYWAVLIGTLIFVMANLMVGLVLTFAEFRYPPSGWLRVGLVIISILLLLSPIVSYIVLTKTEANSNETK